MNKSILGHSHTPGIAKGSYQVGSACRMHDINYNATPSKWQHGPMVAQRQAQTQMQEIASHPVPRRREAVEATRRKYAALET